MLIILIALLIFKPASLVLRWIATPLLISAAVIGLLALATFSADAVVLGYAAVLPAGLKPVATGAVGAIVGGIRNSLFVSSGGLGISALLGYLGAFILSRK